MATVSEVGHAKNVAHLHTVIITCIGFGSKYNPARAEIKIAALQSLYDLSFTQLKLVSEAKANYQNTANIRRDAFASIKLLATKIMAALTASDVSDKTIADARAINRKLQGTRLSKKTSEMQKIAVADDATNNANDAANDTNDVANDANDTAKIADKTDDKGISSSQQSYDQIVEHFRALINLLELQTNYIPNETALQLSTLKALLNSLLTANQNVINATVFLSNARASRNNAIYAANTGLFDIVKNVKAYAKSIFGAKSPEYKQLSKLNLTKLR